ncbi:LppX_LprAFG lipoprotein [Streptomyces sp. H27-G5]|uniref:LppX_LprAFG lipoprotein n=1 Tax=Streptomyces sp. H27-G5 TaxID=2996698 RepID=UPI00226E65B1|nr:LppX_LprAFG lipoprotein [Streptomyces sp. H27-G5]MCY0917616.1 LppX_LprAFG lipoprotein [Streptomyces sp. H27-G5]
MLVHRNKTAGAVLAAVLLVGGATACEDGKKDGAAKPAAPAATPSKAAVQVTPAAYLEKVKKKSEEITSLRYTMSGTAMGEKVSGEASMRMKPTVAMAMKMATPGATGGAESVEIRMLDGAMYMGTDGKWMKFDIKAMDPETAKQMENLGQASQSGQNPSDQADALLKAQDLTSLGDETIDGVKTRHLIGTVPLEKMRASLATATPEEKQRQEKSLKALEDEGIKSLTLDMWIDEQDHTKQVRTRGAATKGPMDMTIKFLDFNKPVEITAPPADQVMDLGQMMKDSGAQG